MSSSPAASPTMALPDTPDTPSPAPAKAQSQNFRMLSLLLPRLPLMVRVAVMHVLRLSESAKYLDLRSALVVSVLRSILEPSPSKARSISSIQRLTTIDPGVKGRIWVSTYTTSVPPELHARDALLQAIRDMADAELLLPGGNTPNPSVELTPVEAEWTGYRAGASSAEEPLPRLSQKELYDEMMKECSEPTTILYLHGGAYYLCDPSTHRPTTRKLAKLTGGRCYSVRYRLAPQHPFPAALLDALVSYLTLLYPPPDAYHEAVKPEHIVFAGDSAGGNLALALTQLLLEFRRKKTTIKWHGELRDLPLPAAVTLNSPWLDMTQSSPSWEGDSSEPFDYLPKPETMARATIKSCSIWPATPPRRYLYVDDALVTHPLASVLVADSWEGAPPMYMCTGWEILAPEDKYLARRLRTQGVPIVFEEYEAMPHCFALVLGQTPGSVRCFDRWAGFIRQVVGGEDIASEARTVKARTLEDVVLDFEGLSDVSGQEMKRRVLVKAGFLENGETSTAKL